MQRLVRHTIVAIVVAAPALAGASTWEIDPAHSSATFAVILLVIAKVRGALGPVTGSVTLDESDLTKSSVTASVDAKGIDTREAKRDEHLRGPDFLDVAKHPTITFQSTRVERVSDTEYRVTGDLTLHGVTKPVTLAVQGSPKPMQDPFGNTKLGGTATTTLDRREFGIEWNKALDGGGLVVGDEIDVTIDVELIRKN